MLDKITGSKTAQLALLHLFHHGETFPSAVANDFEIAVSQVQKQLERFEEAGVLVSKLVGRTRTYRFNEKSGTARAFKELVKREYDSLLTEEKDSLFKTRRRPRRKGKPVLGRGV